MLWESCDALRGGMDPSQYKDYVLTMLFVKYVSDKKRAGDEMLSDLPDECLFERFKSLKNNPNIGEEINKALERLAVEMGLDNAFTNADFNNEDKLGKGKDKVDTITSLIEVFENKNLDFGTNRAGDDDLIGDAYEYLMRNFASHSGKSKGQFYTPSEVSRLMAKILDIRGDQSRQINIYDPACGSGSLLLRAMAEGKKDGTVIGIYGQEKDLATYNMARMNMVLHGMYWSDLRQDDTLNSPQHRQGTQLDTFDYVVANPPFSLKKWMKSAKEQDVYGRWSPLDAELPRLDHSSLLSLPIPPQKEQRRIAQVLSDTDSLIASLSRTIEKKRLVKQGAMQQLLTGKTRLKGFSGEWGEKELGEIGQLTGAGVDKTIKEEETPVRLLNFLDVYNRDRIYSRELKMWVTASEMKIQKCDIRCGDIFLTPSSELPNDIGRSAVAMQDIQDACYSYHILRLRPYDKLDLNYSAYMLKTADFEQQIRFLSEGSGKRYVISLKNFREIRIRIPSDIREQEAIGLRIATMDNEISSLEAELQKYKALKQGMMQKLLTGQIRLK